MIRSSSIRRIGIAVAMVALLAACSSGGDDTEAAPQTDGDGDAATFPVTVDSNGTELTIQSQPTAIVSLSATATEMLFAIGAGDQVAAVDSFSNHPEEAPTTDLSAFDPNVEAIIAFEPDLVILPGDRNDVVAGLAAVDVPTLILPAAVAIADSYAQIEKLGVATGHVGDAAEVVATMQADIAALVAQVPERAEPVTYFHELDDTLYSVTSSTFIGEIYSLAGLTNVADAADPDGESFGYPQLSAEFLVEADPDFIFLADTKCCGQSLETVAARAGFGGLQAVEKGQVIALDDDIASRWGPRIVDFLRVIVDATATVEAAA